jgi:hypothetical protein
MRTYMPLWRFTETKLSSCKMAGMLLFSFNLSQNVRKKGKFVTVTSRFQPEEEKMKEQEDCFFFLSVNKKQKIRKRSSHDTDTIKSLCFSFSSFKTSLCS